MPPSRRPMTRYDTLRHSYHVYVATTWPGASLSPLTQFYLVEHPGQASPGNLSQPSAPSLRPNPTPKRTRAPADCFSLLDIVVGQPTEHWTSGGGYHRFCFVPDAGKKPASPTGEAAMPFEE